MCAALIKHRGGVGRSAVLPRAPQVQRRPEPGQQTGETAQQGSLGTSQPTTVESSCLNQERQGQEAEGQSHGPSKIIFQGWLPYKPFQGPRIRGRAGYLYEGPGGYHSDPKFHFHFYISFQEVKEERRNIYVIRQ